MNSLVKLSYYVCEDLLIELSWRISEEHVSKKSIFYKIVCAVTFFLYHWLNRLKVMLILLITF